MRLSQPSTLFVEFLHRMNQSLAEDRRDATTDLFMLAAERSVHQSGQFDVAVYAQSPDQPVDHYTVRYANGSFELVSRGSSGSANVVELPICQLDEMAEPERPDKEPG